MAVGLGEPVSRAAIINANHGNVANTSNPGATLISILGVLQSLATVLAPRQYRQVYNVTGMAAGGAISTNFPYNGDSFNGFLIRLSSGIINIYIGNTFFMQVSAAPNPTNIFLPLTNVQGGFQFQCDTTSPDDAIGFIDVLQY